MEPIEIYGNQDISFIVVYFAMCFIMYFIFVLPTLFQVKSDIKEKGKSNEDISSIYVPIIIGYLISGGIMAIGLELLIHLNILAKDAIFQPVPFVIFALLTVSFMILVVVPALESLQRRIVWYFYPMASFEKFLWLKKEYS